MDDLQSLREAIDEVDSQLLDLFTKRMELAKNVNKIKQAEGKPTYDRKREEDILQRVSEKCPPHLCSYALEFFRKAMDLSKDFQKEQQ